MTRSQIEQLAFVLRLLRAGELNYGTAINMLLNMVEAAEREHVDQGTVTTPEQSAKGTGNDHSKRSI